MVRGNLARWGLGALTLAGGVAAAVALLVVSGSQEASASVQERTVIATARLSIRYTAGPPHAFKGRLRARPRICRPDRKVKILRGVPGPNELIGTDQTDTTGHWSLALHGSAKPGRYIARVKDKGIDGSRCLGVQVVTHVR